MHPDDERDFNDDANELVERDAPFGWFGPHADTPEEQRERSDHGRPVDDGPGQHRANARTNHSPTRPGKVQDF